MDIVTSIEDACVQRLAVALRPLEVAVRPGRPDPAPPEQREAVAWLAYCGSRLKKRQGTSAIAQRRTLRFQLALSARELRSANGLYAQLAEVYRSLPGFRPAGAEPCWIKRDGRIRQSATGWRCEVLLACRVTAVAQPDIDAAPRLAVVNHEESSQ